MLVAGIVLHEAAAKKKYWDPCTCYADVQPEAAVLGQLLAGKVLCRGSDSATPKLNLRMV